MGRHSRFEQPDDEPTPGAGTPRGSYYGAPVDPTYDAFSGPTDDRVVVEPNDQARRGARPVADRRHDPPGPFRFEPLPGTIPATTRAPRARRSPSSRANPRSAGAGGHVRRPRRSRRARLDQVRLRAPAPSAPDRRARHRGGDRLLRAEHPADLPQLRGGSPHDADRPARQPGLPARPRRARQPRRPPRRPRRRLPRRVPGTGRFQGHRHHRQQGRQPVAAWALAFKIPNATVTAVSGATVVRGGPPPSSGAAPPSRPAPRCGSCSPRAARRPRRPPAC